MRLSFFDGLLRRRLPPLGASLDEIHLIPVGAPLPLDGLKGVATSHFNIIPPQHPTPHSPVILTPFRSTSTSHALNPARPIRGTKEQGEAGAKEKIVLKGKARGSVAN